MSQPSRFCGSASSWRARRATMVWGESAAGAARQDQLLQER